MAQRGHDQTRTLQTLTGTRHPDKAAPECCPGVPRRAGAAAGAQVIQGLDWVRQVAAGNEDTDACTKSPARRGPLPAPTRRRRAPVPAPLGFFF